jgi:hypothetical protein
VAETATSERPRNSVAGSSVMIAGTGEQAILAKAQLSVDAGQEVHPISKPSPRKNCNCVWVGPRIACNKRRLQHSEFHENHQVRVEGQRKSKREASRTSGWGVCRVLCLASESGPRFACGCLFERDHHRSVCDLPSAPIWCRFAKEQEIHCSRISNLNLKGSGPELGLLERVVEVTAKSTFMLLKIATNILPHAPRQPAMFHIPESGHVANREAGFV